MPRSYYHLHRDNPFYQRLRGRLPVSQVMSLYKFVKESRVQQILHALKYKQQPEIGEYLGRLYGQDLADADFRDRFDIVIPVPLHISRRRVRGYNQSEEFGKGLAHILGIPCDDTSMERSAANTSQTDKGRMSRWTNVSRIFQVVRPEVIVGKRILLVDDVLTTGATLEACGLSLLDAGCAELSMACIAATQ